MTHCVYVCLYVGNGCCCSVKRGNYKNFFVAWNVYAHSIVNLKPTASKFKLMHVKITL